MRFGQNHKYNENWSLADILQPYAGIASWKLHVILF